MTISASDARHRRLLTDDDKVSRIRALLAPACHPSQLWVLPLDADGVQIPLVLPLAGRPVWPDPAIIDMLLGRLVAVMSNLTGGAGSLLFVLERVGPFGELEADHCWSAAIHGACDRAGVACAGVFLLSPGGVLAVAP
jgi:hypothetical protein